MWVSRRDARSWLLTDGVDRLYENGRFRPTYMGDYYLRLCAEMGCEVPSKELELFIDVESKRRVDELFKDCNLNNGLPLILLNPGLHTVLQNAGLLKDLPGRQTS